MFYNENVYLLFWRGVIFLFFSIGLVLIYKDKVDYILGLYFKFKVFIIIYINMLYGNRWWKRWFIKLG